jgi:hypothetical protein
MATTPCKEGGGHNIDQEKIKLTHNIENKI